MSKMNRRQLLVTSSSMGLLTACSARLEPPNPVEVASRMAIDIHAHIFNARDIPMKDFLSAVVFSPDRNPGFGDDLKAAILAFLAEIFFFSGTKTAGEELRSLPDSPIPLPKISEQELLAYNRSRIESAVEVFARKPAQDEYVMLEDQSSAPSLRANDSEVAVIDAKTLTSIGLDARQQNGLLKSADALALEFPDAVKFADITQTDQFEVTDLTLEAGEYTSRSKREVLTKLDQLNLSLDLKAIVSPGDVSRQVIAQKEGISAGTYGAFPNNSRVRLASGGVLDDFDLEATMAWAALLSRDRREILSEHIRLYDEPIDVISPSIVDFDYWLVREFDKVKSRQRMVDQINVMSRIAKITTEKTILNFAPFCPLRAHFLGDDWHQVLRDAVMNKGFVGIKIYPPMGFRPIGNETRDFSGREIPLKYRNREISGAKIDAQLMKMYNWCAKHDVPIKSHGTNSLSAQECTGVFASPVFWGEVLNQPGLSGLRVNVAHFGGFDERSYSENQKACFRHLGHNHGQGKIINYENIATDLISSTNNLYVDIGYWADVAFKGQSNHDTIAKLVKDLLSKNPELAKRIMFGTDFSMIGRERGHNAFIQEVKGMVVRLGLSEGDIFERNALRYLNLDPKDNTPAYRRLLRFLERDPFPKLTAA